MEGVCHCEIEWDGTSSTVMGPEIELLRTSAWAILGWAIMK